LAIGNWQLAIRNSQFAIRNSQFAIRRRIAPHRFARSDELRREARSPRSENLTDARRRETQD